MDLSLALVEAAQRGDTAALYAVLRQNPFLLEDIDKVPFVNTPLHTAASAGSTHFAIEILGLKPSFAKKLNPDGYSPINVALASGQTQTVKQLIRYDPELIRVKSKERFTPLHYVAEMDDADLLAEFLVSCPKSIKDLTVRGETAVHIAVKSRKMRAFKVLLGWLSEADIEQILDWQDEKGNTALHIATSTNNLEAVRLLLKKRKINRYKKNVDGLTALNIATRLPNAGDKGSIANRLRGAVTQGFSASSENLADRFILISEASFWRKVLMRFLSLLKVWCGDNTTSDETREAPLVVLVLIATATYQAMLTPPDVLRKEKDEANHFKFSLLHGFLLLNSGTFLVSIFMMCYLFKTDRLGSWMKISLMYLVSCYAVVMLSYFPVEGCIVVFSLLFAFWYISTLIKCWPTVRKVLTRI